MRYYCPGCGHHHGNEQCTATTHDEATDGARKCGCTREEKQAA